MKKIFLIILIFLGGWYYPGSSQKVITIGVVTDVQYCNCNTDGTRYYKSSLAKLDECIKFFNQYKLDFVTHLGDLIDRDFTGYDSVLTRFKKSTAPVYHVLGNHDFNIGNRFKKEALQKIGLEQYYYSKVIEDWQFIFLNGDELSFFFPKTKTQRDETQQLYKRLIAKLKCNALPWNGGISKKQMSWLKLQLEDAAKSNRKVVIVCHFPVYPAACHNLWNDEELISLLTKYKCVKAYFCGHNHKGDYGFKDGIHYITFKGMVETADSTSFSKVTFTQDSIFVEGHGRELSRRLKIL